MDDRAKVLEVSGLQVKLKTDAGAVSLLEPTHFELKRGQVLGLVGESGSGKTVTCKALLQLLDRQTMDVEGSVRLNGRELNGMAAEEIRRIRGKEIAFIMQNPMSAFTPVYTIGAQFMETVRTHTGLTKRQARDLAITALENMNLSDPAKLMKRYSFQLSGGMLQRVMIAISMCLQPAVVIADEPTTALDVVNQLQVLRELDRLRTEYNTSILLISHDLGVISQLADEVAVMQQGRIVEQAEVHQLFDHPQDEYTKMLLQVRPKLSIRGMNQVGG